jgi:hypothetical protein
MSIQILKALATQRATDDVFPNLYLEKHRPYTAGYALWLEYSGSPLYSDQKANFDSDQRERARY